VALPGSELDTHLGIDFNPDNVKHIRPDNPAFACPLSDLAAWTGGHVGGAS